MKFAGEQVYAWHLPVPKAPQRHAPNGTATPSKRFVTRLDLVLCPQCQANVGVAQQVRKLLPQRHHVWRLDLQRVTVQCARCKGCFQVFAYPLFNWVSPYRIITALALLLFLIALLVLGQL
jgi:hypothetical protein